MSRVPIRLRLTAAFAAATLLVLVLAGAFVYVGVRDELDESVTTTVEARVDALAARVDRPGGRLVATGDLLDPEDAFAQVVAPDGRVLDRIGGGDEPAIAPSDVGPGSGTVVVDADVEAVDSTARVAARRVSERPDAPIVIAGQSLDDRDETLAGLLATFAIAGPIAVVLASLLGYLLAAAGLAPMEAMRRRATEVSLEGDDTLPLPAADDEVRRLAQTLNEMLERLRRSFERERRFVADASHELRTPVAVLRIEVEAALEAAGDEPVVAESLRAALEECDHLAQLTEDLLVVARAGDGELPVRPEPMQARALLDDVRRRFSVRADRDGRALRVEARDDLELRADPLRIRQALGNLVDNALRYGSGEVVLAAQDNDRGVELSVRDAGDGFPDDLRATAFDRFTRGDVARTRGGTGLGLAIVRMIARSHGGDAELVPGDGGGVRVRLPRG